MTKVVIFGCQKICIEFVKYLKNKKNIEISIIFTSERKNDKDLPYSSINQFCKKNKFKFSKKLPIGPKEIKIIKNIKPDIIFSIYYRAILPIEVLNIPSLGSFNIHPSLLPFYKGSVPTAWAILNNEKYFGITIHKISKKVDSGDILIQKKFKINNNETGYELHNRAMRLGLNMLKKNFTNIIHNKLKSTKQKKLGSQYGRLPKSNKIKWSSSSINIYNRYRVYAYPFKGSYSFIKNRKIYINRMKIINKNNDSNDIGEINRVYSDHSFDVKCKHGYIKILNYSFSKKLTNFETRNYIKEGNLLK